MSIWRISCLVGLLGDHPGRDPRLLAPAHVAHQVLGRRQVLPLGRGIPPGPDIFQVVYYCVLCVVLCLHLEWTITLGMGQFCDKVVAIYKTKLTSSFPGVLVVGVEGGIVACGLRGQVESRCRGDRLPL